MTKLLFIQASPRGDQSKSIQVAQTYLDALKATNPALEVDVLPLWETELPAFDGDKAAAKVNVFLGQEQNAAQKNAWVQIVGDRLPLHQRGPLPVRVADVEWHDSVSAEAVHRHHPPAGCPVWPKA